MAGVGEGQAGRAEFGADRAVLHGAALRPVGARQHRLDLMAAMAGAQDAGMGGASAVGVVVGAHALGTAGADRRRLAGAADRRRGFALARQKRRQADDPQRFSHLRRPRRRALATGPSIASPASARKPVATVAALRADRAGGYHRRR